LKEGETMKPIGDVMKKTSTDFMKTVIRKKYPNLANTEFELDQRLGQCPGCKQTTIPEFWIKRENDDDFRKVPMGSTDCCVKCEDRQMAKEAVTAHKRLKQEKVTSQFWIVPPELNKEGLATYKPEDPEQIEAMKMAVQYLKDFKSGERYNLFFRGSYGGGKSHLLKGIADAVKGMTKTDPDGDEIPLTVGFFTMDNLLDIVKGTFGRREGQTENEIINHVIGLDFLVIDDLGTESGEWAGKQLFKIINGRIGKPTAFSTNFMDMGELSKRFDVNGGKIVSRLHSNTKIIDLITKDMRIEKMRG
jgi:DNA replication protein DnaC